MKRLTLLIAVILAIATNAWSQALQGPTDADKLIVFLQAMTEKVKEYKSAEDIKGLGEDYLMPEFKKYENSKYILTETECQRFGDAYANMYEEIVSIAENRKLSKEEKDSCVKRIIEDIKKCKTLGEFVKH